MNSPKYTIGADDINKDAAQRGIFFSSELGHSPKKNLKLLGRSIGETSTTIMPHPYHKACGFSVGSSVLVRILKFWCLPEANFPSE